MDIVSAYDIVCFKALLTASATYLAAHCISKFRTLPAEPLLPSETTREISIYTRALKSPTRGIRKLLEESNKRCIVFYGSETGTAEMLATRFVRAARARYSLEAIAVDLEDCDYGDLTRLGQDYAVIFLLATAGEGEPTTNAGRFTEHLNALSNETKYDTLRFAAFGLGSSSYRQFNLAVKSVTARLNNLGAQQLGQVGLGDDGKGTLEDDFMCWTNETLPHIAMCLGLEKTSEAYKPILRVTERDQSPAFPVLAGEPNKAQLYGRLKGPFTAKNPFPASVQRSHQLTSPKCDRKCAQIEFDISKSTLAYSTGDHLAIMPTNCEREVERFLDVFGLSRRADTVIDVKSTDATVPVPFPALTTYRAAISKYMNICGPVSKQALLALSETASNMEARETICALVDDPDAFTEAIRGPHLNLAQALQRLTSPGTFYGTDFATLIEIVGMLKTRYYSISSSNLVSKKTISVTVMEEKKMEPGWVKAFHGVSSGYLADLIEPANGASHHRVSGPNGVFDTPTAYIHVRKSQFRMPRSTRTPIIMIGPGTGVAPFRAFVQERAFQSQRGRDIGKTLLFYGCRRDDEDFLYKDEWRNLATFFPSGTFEMYTALSRMPGTPKLYVQDKLHEQARQVCDLIFQQGAHVYVCGNAGRMAKDVRAVMERIIAEHSDFNGCIETAGNYISAMRKEKRWQEDVW